MNNNRREIDEYLKQAFKFLDGNGILTEMRKSQILDYALSSEKNIEDIKKEIDEKRDKVIEKYKNVQEKINQMKIVEENKYEALEVEAKNARNPNIPIAIEKINISDMDYETLEKMFFHYTLKANYYSINENGLHAVIGVNSQGIDKKPSIFFSGGVEAVLQTWDVWLKWRMNRLNNPLWQGKTVEEVNHIQEMFKTGQATSEQYYEMKKWTEEYLSGQYKEDPEKLQELYEYQIAELSHSIYLSLPLKEGRDFVKDQIDHKKENNFQNKDNPNSKTYGFFKEMYGNYTDYSSTTADKWNMQTIPGKKLVINSDEITQLVTGDGKEDVLSIVNEFYKMYKENVPEEKQSKFDLLDSFMKYANEKNSTEIEEDNYVLWEEVNPPIIGQNERQIINEEKLKR